MDRKQKLVVSIILVAFLSIVLNELKLWDWVYIIVEWIFTYISIPAEMLAVFLSVRLYRTFHNPFFKFQGFALALNATVTGLEKLLAVYVKKLIFSFDKTLFAVFDDFISISNSVNIICGIIGLSGMLMALYALLRYRESWEHREGVSLVKRFNDLVPSVGSNMLFWFIIFGVPLLLTVPILLSSFSVSFIEIIFAAISAAWLPAGLLCLLLTLALLRVYKNNLFKYLAVVYITPLAITALSYFNAYLTLFQYRFINAKPSLFLPINDYMLFYGVVLVFLVYALFTYKESKTGPTL